MWWRHVCHWKYRYSRPQKRQLLRTRSIWFLVLTTEPSSLAENLFDNFLPVFFHVCCVLTLFFMYYVYKYMYLCVYVIYIYLIIYIYIHVEFFHYWDLVGLPWCLPQTHWEIWGLCPWYSWICTLDLSRQLTALWQHFSHDSLGHFFVVSGFKYVLSKKTILGWRFPNLTNTFYMGWNHQPEFVCFLDS